MFVSIYAVLILLELSQFIYWPLGIFTPVIWRRSARYYFKLEYYCRWPFQRRWPDVKHTLSVMNGVVLERLILKTCDTVSPLSRPLPVGVDKQGLDFSACQAFFSPCLSWSFERPLSLPPRITEHKDTQSCGVIQFVLSSLPHRLFA